MKRLKVVRSMAIQATFTQVTASLSTRITNLRAGLAAFRKQRQNSRRTELWHELT